ncbi:MAG: hypothetical protein ACR652_24430 [Methylocystis sp.]|uniref:hypothetical protein n=1 Tax=Methylocystis sp. TaxID=1911079 RepID=UPI003DA4ED6C
MNAITRGRKPDPAAEKIRLRKERKARDRQRLHDRAILTAIRTNDLSAAQHILLKIKGVTPPPVSFDEECPVCLKRQNAA